VTPGSQNFYYQAIFLDSFSITKKFILIGTVAAVTAAAVSSVEPFG
jgi:hypothetical protein